MSSGQAFQVNNRPCGTGGTRTGRALKGHFTRAVVVCLLAAPLASCVLPVDSGANEAYMALEQIDYALYTIRDENALLQAQVDSLGRALRKTDSLLRVVANLTGNPIIDTQTVSTPLLNH
jgi:hypothetical protein